MRDVLEAAFAQMEEEVDVQQEPEESVEEVTEADGEESPERAEETESMGDGETEETGAESEPFEDAETDQPAPDSDVGEDSQASEDKRSLKAPVNWTPANREKWSKVPRELQETILSRESEINANLKNTAQARQVFDRINNMANHFQPVILGEGHNNPLDAMESMLNTVTKLRLGTPQEKAHLVHSLINNYGVDVRTLDDLIVHGMSNPQQQYQQQPNIERQVQSMVDQRLAPIMQQVQHRQDSRIRSEIDQFAQSAEFFQDVRLDMADMMQMSDQRGQPITLQEAYDRAVYANPNTRKVLENRKRSKQYRDQRKSVESKKNASSSISGKQGGSVSGPQHDDIRSALSAAMEG